MVNQLTDTLNRCDMQTFDGFVLLRHVRFRYDCLLEAMLGRFTQAFLAVWYRAYFTRQADLAERNQVIGQRFVSETGQGGK